MMIMQNIIAILIIKYTNSNDNNNNNNNNSNSNTNNYDKMIIMIITVSGVHQADKRHIMI